MKPHQVSVAREVGSRCPLKSCSLFFILFDALWDGLLIAVDLFLLLFKPRPNGFRHETFVIIRVNWENENVSFGTNHVTEAIIPILSGLRGVNEITLIPILKPVEGEIERLLDLCRRHVGIRLDIYMK